MLCPTLLLAFLPQSELPEAAALLDRREGALGALEARARIHGIVMRGRMEMTGSNVHAPFEDRYRLVDGGEQVLHNPMWSGDGANTQGTDGRVSWSTDPGFGVMVKEGASQGPPRRLWAICRSAPWRSLYASAHTLGRVERDGRAQYELEMRPREGAAERWYLDAETNQLARVALVFPGPTGEQLPMVWSFRAWKAVDGVLYPHERVQEILGAQFGGDEQMQEPAHAPMVSILYRVESVVHRELTPAEVAPPVEVAAAIADPSKRAQAPPADASKCVLETHAQELVASIRVTIPDDKVSITLAALLPEIGGVLAKLGVQPAGPPFTRYHRIDHEEHEIELESGIAVRTAFKPTGRVQLSELPAGRAAMTWHVGPYDKLEQSYERLGAWIREQKLKASGPFWEVYWTDPGLEPDASTWRTQVWWPVE
ncbi:MAG: AraC family transcriptional regulator [Planctomycetes bacterium]|nr:AraC family transcriptional regulator [Planctomycetota bacterium]